MRHLRGLLRGGEVPGVGGDVVDVDVPTSVSPAIGIAQPAGAAPQLIGARAFARRVQLLLYE